MQTYILMTKLSPDLSLQMKDRSMKFTKFNSNEQYSQWKQGIRGTDVLAFIPLYP